MRMLIQRVQSASVEAEGRIVGSIDRGLLIFLAIQKDDTEALIPWMARKAIELRIFPNEKGKADLNVQDIQGSVLVVSQFTLYADCRMGRRPDFLQAAPAFLARALYELFAAECAKLLGSVETGLFGASMQVSLVNDGPFTVLIDSPSILNENSVNSDDEQEEEKKN